MAGPTDYAATVAGNDGKGIFDESQAPSTVNNGGRQVMADIKNYETVLTDTGSANAYACATPSASQPSALNTGLRVMVDVQNANTGASTLTVDSLTATSIKLPDGNDPRAGEIQAGLHVFRYDGTNWILMNPFDAFRIPVGAELMWPASAAPTGWFIENGAEKSMTTYEALYDVIGNDYGMDAGATCTADAGTDAVTDTSHGLSDLDVIEFTNSGGGLPGGLSADTKYYIRNSTANTFQVSTTKTGSVVDITTAGTGTHSYHVNFKLPDPRGRFIRIVDGSAGVDPDAGTRTDRGDSTTGDNVGTNQADEFEAHTHTVDIDNGGTSNGANIAQTSSTSLTAQKTSSSAGGTTETRPINTYRHMIIKY